jgi:hypothetical protein
MKCVIAFIYVAAFFACRQNCLAISGDVTEIRIVSGEANRTDLLQFIEDIHLTPLETGNDCLIGNVRRVKAEAGRFYITDYADNPVKVFSGDGKFVSAIGRKGAGPGEYIQISDMLVSGDTVSIFAWNGNKKWIRYSIKNRFLYETGISFPFDDICRMENGNYLVYITNATVSSESNFSLCLVDKNLKMRLRLDPKKPPEDIPLPVEQNNFYRSAEHNTLFYLKEYSDTVYTISDNLDILPKYHLDFGKNWYTKNFLKRYHDSHYMEIHGAVNRNKYARFVNFWENDSHAIVNYYISREGGERDYETYLAVYCKRTGKTFVFKSAPGNAANLVIHPYCVWDNLFTGLIATDELLDLASSMTGNDPVSEKIRKCAEQVSEGDNPVLVQFRFKSH